MEQITTLESQANSPISLVCLLMPLLLGVSDETLDEIAIALRIEPSHTTNFVQSMTKNHKKLTQNGSLEIANIMLSRSDVCLKQSYLNSIHKSTNHSYFSSNDVNTVVSHVNNIVKHTTHGMIESILNDDEVTSDTLMVLLNTIYFKSDWEIPFDSQFTLPKLFLKREEQFMYLHKKRFQYQETLQHQILLLPYKNDDFAFCIVLPKDPNDVPPVHNILDRESPYVKDVIKNGSKQLVNLSLPKFTQRAELNIIPILQEAGIKKIFDYTMQTQRMIDNCTLPVAFSVIKQKVVIEVDEIGTEASGVTAGVMQLGCCAPNFETVIKFNCNHPFTYYIVNMPLEYVLFSGVYA